MSEYKIGTVTVTNGDATVTGVGTSWLAEVSAGDYFSLQGVGGVIYEVLSVTNDAALELTTTYAGATEAGKNYWVFRDFTSPDNFPILSEGDVDTHRVVARLATTIQTKINSLVSALTGGAWYASKVNDVVAQASTIQLPITTSIFANNVSLASNVLTPSEAGYYEVSCTYNAQNNTSDGSVIIDIYKNLVSVFNRETYFDVLNAYQAVECKAVFYCNGTTDTIKIEAYSDVGQTTFNYTSTNSLITVKKLST